MRTSALIILAIAVAFLYETAQLDPGARRVPLAVAVPLMVLALLLVVRAFSERRRPTDTGEPAKPLDPAAPSSPLRALLWVASLPAAVFTLGLQVGAPLFVLLFLRVRGRERWSVTVVGAAMAAAVVAVLFRVLDASIPTGWLLS